VSYDGLPDDTIALRRRPLWKRALVRVQSGEMPPEGETPLTTAEKQTLVEWMTMASEYLDCNSQDAVPTVLRRLTRTEYDRTIRDLLGVDFRSADEVGMPEEGVVDGFENTSAALASCPALIDKYLAAAEKVLDLLYSPRYQKRLEAISQRPADEVSDDEAARQIAQRLVRGPIARP
jgi:hypothetical protein